jgi:hypothetical protein
MFCSFKRNSGFIGSGIMQDEMTATACYGIAVIRVEFRADDAIFVLHKQFSCHDHAQRASALAARSESGSLTKMLCPELQNEF